MILALINSTGQQQYRAFHISKSLFLASASFNSSRLIRKTSAFRIHVGGLTFLGSLKGAYIKSALQY